MLTLPPITEPPMLIGAAAHRAADLNVVALDRAADLNVYFALDGAADRNFGTVMIVFCDVARCPAS